MISYPSIENLFTRDPDSHKLTPELRLPAFGQVDSWLVTEKIDGTNVRVICEIGPVGVSIEVRGRSDAAQLPTNFISEALPDFLFAPGGQQNLIEAFDAIDNSDKPLIAVLFGEGYGSGIQKGGGDYAAQKSFRAFDLLTYRPTYQPDGWAEGTGTLHKVLGPGLWRTFEDVEAFSLALGLKTVPVLGWHWRTADVIEYVKAGNHSHVTRLDRGTEIHDRDQEGVVARTDPYLYDFHHNRILFKLKGKDLVGYESGRA